MLDVKKLQDKNRLAKELMQKGVVSDIEEAYKQIEEKGMIKTSDDFNVSEISVCKMDNIAIDDPEKTPDTELSEDDKHKVKLEKLEAQVNCVISFIEEFQKKTNSNLQEMEEAVKGMRGKLTALEEGSVTHSVKEPEQQKIVSEPKKEASSDNRETHPKTGGCDPEEFKIENIFDNSGNKMTNRTK